MRTSQTVWKDFSWPPLIRFAELRKFVENIWVDCKMRENYFYTDFVAAPIKKINNGSLSINFIQNQFNIFNYVVESFEGIGDSNLLNTIVWYYPSFAFDPTLIRYYSPICISRKSIRRVLANVSHERWASPYCELSGDSIELSNSSAVVRIWKNTRYHKNVVIPTAPYETVMKSDLQKFARHGDWFSHATFLSLIPEF